VFVLIPIFCVKPVRDNNSQQERKIVMMSFVFIVAFYREKNGRTYDSICIKQITVLIELIL
jgi:hypothetical protein